MKVIIQRSKNSYVSVNNKNIASIDFGMVVFLAIEKNDTENDLNYLIDKILNIRIFSDKEGKLNYSLIDIKGSILLISQFTLCANTRNGRRPSFINAEDPIIANKYYTKMVNEFRNKKIRVATGKFQTDMQVSILNDGPVTIIIDTKKKDE